MIIAEDPFIAGCRSNVQRFRGTALCDMGIGADTSHRIALHRCCTHGDETLSGYRLVMFTQT
jgi:hypothetical protein